MNEQRILNFRRKSGAVFNKKTRNGIIVFILIGIFITIKEKISFWWALTPLLVFGIVPELIKKVLVSVTLDYSNREATLVLNRWGRFYKEITVPVNNLNVSYKEETGLYIGKSKVMRLFNVKEEIVVVYFTNGWEQETLESLVSAINELKGEISDNKLS